MSVMCSSMTLKVSFITGLSSPFAWPSVDRRRVCWISAARFGRGSGDEADRCGWGDSTDPCTSEVLVCRDACGVVCSLSAEVKDDSTGVVGSIWTGDSVVAGATTGGGAGSVCRHFKNSRPSAFFVKPRRSVSHQQLHTLTDSPRAYLLGRGPFDLCQGVRQATIHH